MNLTFLAYTMTILAQEAPAGAAPAAGAGAGSMLPMMVLLFALMYFMIIRPQRRQQKEHAARIAALRSGAEVITTGGIYGIITNVKDSIIILKVADNVRIKVSKACVATILQESDEPVEAEPASATDESTPKA